MVIPKVLILSMLPLITAHSWVEVLYRIDSGGNAVGNPGYIRGYIPRASMTSDLELQNLLPPTARKCNQFIHSSDLICKNTQRFREDISGLKYRPLVASPGERIALLYQENGHVTLPDNTPQKNGSGEIFIYGTSVPSNRDTLLSIHKVWNEDGTGGDRRGRLLARQQFDDGRCYQVNNGVISKNRQKMYPTQDDPLQGKDVWCQNNASLPLSIQNHYTLYWVWDWPSTPTQQFPSGQTEIYTSCMDITVEPAR